MKKSVEFLMLGILVMLGWLYVHPKIYAGLSGEKIMRLTSTAFSHGQRLPDQFTCLGADHNPPLSWGPVPAGTKSFVLILDDPDAPGGTWLHWLVFNIPATVTNLKENVNISSLGSDVRPGTTSAGTTKFHGACPPPGHGVHHYFFRVYALDTMLVLPEGVSREKVENAMKGHILAEAQLMALFGR
jgi:Raf kinase inhibitor-like YbhB/YbcL family protein